MGETEAVNNSVQSGSGTAELAVRSLPFEFPWQTTEMLNMVTWMRSHNAANATAGNAPLVSFRGFDMQFPHLPMDNVEAYVQRVDAPTASRVRELNSCFRPYVDKLSEYTNLLTPRKDECRANLQRVYDDLRGKQSAYEAASSSSPREFAKALHSARIVLQAEECFSEPNCLTRDRSKTRQALETYLKRD